MSFIYTSCPDVNGCPLATFVLGQVQQRLVKDESTRENVRLVSVSFDPANDTPDVMANYGRDFRRGSVDWHFLTAESEDSLDPILDDYDQFVIRDRDPDGKALSTMSHVLRVYLIDADKRVRNIYSPSFLHADLLHADLDAHLDADLDTHLDTDGDADLYRNLDRDLDPDLDTDLDADLDAGANGTGSNGSGAAGRHG